MSLAGYYLPAGVTPTRPLAKNKVGQKRISGQLLQYFEVFIRCYFTN